MRRSILFLPFVLLLLFLFSCGNQENSKSGKGDKSFDGLSYQMEKIFVAENDCTTDSLENCTHVMVEYPVFTNKEMVPANSFINHRIADMMGYGDVESDSMVDLKRAAQRIVDDYADFKKDFPDSPQVWNFRSMTEVIYEKDDLVGLKMLTESYMGGAHGSLVVGYLNFDTKTGKSVHLLNRIADSAGFIALAEKKFRKKRHLAPDADLEEAGYWFPDNKFSLPANIGISNNGYLLHYNPYEVAPYASGPTDIIIGFDEITKK